MKKSQLIERREKIAQLPLAHGLELIQLEEVCAEIGALAFRARQVWSWLYQKRARDWEQMLDIPTELRAALAARLALDSVSTVDFQGSIEAGSTAKLLFRLRDGESVESVLIPVKGRLTLCVSSQVGCKFHCSFCASGQAGFSRQLEAGEIVGQLVAAAAAREGIPALRPSHLVFMGIGEPLDNYDEVLAAVRIVNDKAGLSIGARRITISTCGLVPGIERLAHEGLQLELSVSLHAPDDELRYELMPVNRRYPLVELLRACRDYTAATNRIITFEYALIKEVNDSTAQAVKLARLLEGMKCRVNLIPLNPVREFAGRPSSRYAVNRFANTLRGLRINTTIRASRGGSVNAACGQLRAVHSGLSSFSRRPR